MSFVESSLNFAVLLFSFVYKPLGYLPFGYQRMSQTANLAGGRAHGLAKGLKKKLKFSIMGPKIILIMKTLCFDGWLKIQNELKKIFLYQITYLQLHS